MENPRSLQRCTRSGRRPGSPDGRQRSEKAPGGRAQPAKHTSHANFGAAPKIQPLDLTFERDCGPHAHPQGKLLLLRWGWTSDGSENERARPHTRPGGRQRRLHQHRARRHRAAPRSLGESRPALARPVDNRVRPLARGRPTGPCPIRWRRRAAPLCFCSWPLPHTRRGTNASLRSLASLSAADHAPPTPKISSQLRRS